MTTPLNLMTRRRLLRVGVATAGAMGLELLPIPRARASAVSLACAAPTPEQLALNLGATSASPGDALTAVGSFGVFDPAGQREPVSVGTVDLWWDLDFDVWWSALTPAPVAVSGGAPERVATASTAGQCQFALPFSVPRVATGSYGVLAIARNGMAAECYGPALVDVG